MTRRDHKQSGPTSRQPFCHALLYLHLEGSDRAKGRGKGFGCTAVAVEARLHVISCAKVHGGIWPTSSAPKVQCWREECEERRYLGESTWLALNHHVIPSHDVDPRSN